MHSFTFGTKRQEFFDALDGELEKDEHKWKAFQGLRPDMVYPRVLEVVRSSAQKVFSKGSFAPEKVKQSKQRRQELLQKRRSILLIHFQLVNIGGLQRRTMLSWQIVAKLRSADDNVKKHIQTERGQRQEALTWELRESWRSRRLAECWGACRTLAYASKRAYRKWARFPFTSNPEREDYMNMLSKPGREGGWSATQCENPIGQHVHHDDTISLHAASRLAVIDTQQLIKTTRGGGTRRGCPHWEVPLEVWRHQGQNEDRTWLRRGGTIYWCRSR